MLSHALQSLGLAGFGVGFLLAAGFGLSNLDAEAFVSAGVAAACLGGAVVLGFLELDHE